MIRQRCVRASLEQLHRRPIQGAGSAHLHSRASSEASSSRVPLASIPLLAPPSSRLFSNSKTPRQASLSGSDTSVSDGDQADFSDITIVGGGVVGLALASSLASDPSFQSSGTTLTLIEGSSLDKARQWSNAKEIGDQKSPSQSWENRVIYLTEENRLWLDKIGVTPYLVSSQLGPVHSMLVTDGVSGAALNFDVPNPTSNKMGTMIEISNLQQAMLRHIESLKSSSSGVRINVLDASKVESIEADGEEAAGVNYHTESWPLLRHSASTRPLKSRLLVGADGYSSPVRNYAGIKATGWEYGRMGVVGTMRTSGVQAEERTAFQRFLPTGTIAWLPVSVEGVGQEGSTAENAIPQLSENCASLVWTLPPDSAKAVITMQKVSEAAEEQDMPPLALLITAAFRLPWPSLEAILSRLVTNHQADNHDYTWITTMIEESLMSATEMPAEGNAPPPVSTIDKRSVAGFPLKLSHAECYLGSSLLKTTFAESGAGAIHPSAVLERIIAAATGASDQESRPVRGRTALIGDAAHTIHPLAGQGLNLGLADARSLSASITRAIQVGGDMGSHLSLSSYPKDRYIPNQAMLSAVDHLHWLFATPPPGDARNGMLGNVWSQAVVWGRSNGFEILNELSSVKRALMGFAGSEKRG